MFLSKISMILRRTMVAPPNLKKLKDSSFIQDLAEHGNYIAKMQPKHVEAVLISENTKELELIVTNSGVIPVLRFLRSHIFTQYIQLMDITAVDIPKRPKRFEVIYNLLSIYYNARIRIKTAVDEKTYLESATGVFLSANWPEREIFDMFGIYFTYHPDMRRILTDYGFEGHPLRKDFPLSGHVELRYDNEKMYIVQNPVQFPQEYRKFELKNAWESFPDFKQDVNKDKDTK